MPWISIDSDTEIVSVGNGAKAWMRTLAFFFYSVSVFLNPDRRTRDIDVLAT